jgi:hypothetical protein
MTTTTVVLGQNHVRTWMNPHPIMAAKAQSSIQLYYLKRVSTKHQSHYAATISNV